MSDEQQGQAPEAADTTTTDTTTADTQRTDDTSQDKGPEPKTFDEAYVKKLRDEAASRRATAKELETKLSETEKRQQAQMDAIAKALGLKEDDSPPDPEQLTKQLTAAQEQAQQREMELRTLRVERAAEKAAREHGADVDTLLDSRSFATKLSDLDPTADDFAATVSDLVKTTVDSNPKYRVAQAAASSSADFSSGPGEQRNTRPNSLHAAARNHYGVG
ncbi:hypothetical protein [Nocardiopsis synnemataformans]|uniref:hypothetical protein n=1 Tax=Nocardiopsis synnemataformans TaxID=61305 RepID=UPI003EB84A82